MDALLSCRPPVRLPGARPAPALHAFFERGCCPRRGKIKIHESACFWFGLKRIEENREIQLHPILKSFGQRLESIISRRMLEFEYTGRYPGRVAYFYGCQSLNTTVLERFEGNNSRQQDQSGIHLNPGLSSLKRITSSPENVTHATQYVHVFCPIPFGVGKSNRYLDTTARIGRTGRVDRRRRFRLEPIEHAANLPQPGELQKEIGAT